MFLAKKCTFGPFRAPRGVPPGRALEAGPLALSVEGSASDERAGPVIGGPGPLIEEPGLRIERPGLRLESPASH